jgi:hypothetical protein
LKDTNEGVSPVKACGARVVLAFWTAPCSGYL